MIIPITSDIMRTLKGKEIIKLNIKKKQLIQQNEKLINIVRCYPDIERALLAKYMGISLPTLANLISELKKANILLGKSIGSLQVGKDSLIINPDIGVYVGISIGASQIKVTIVNFDFSVWSQQEFDDKREKCKLFEDKHYIQKENSSYGYVCVQTPNEYEELVDIIDIIMADCIKLDTALKQINSGVIGIGFAITGAIDNESRRIISSYNLDCLKNMTISYDTLIFGNRLSYLNENNIDLSFENIARASIISEKYNLYNKNNINNRHKDKKNIACIYLGSGIGAGLILNNTLYRGTSNFSELGHIEVCDPDNISVPSPTDDCDAACMCGGKNCLEYKIRSKALGISFETFKHMSATKLKCSIDNDENKEDRLRLLGYYIGKATNTLVNILNLDLVIFTGKLTVLMDELWKYLNPVIAANTIAYTTKDCSIVVSSYGPLAPAIGAAMSSANIISSEDMSWV